MENKGIIPDNLDEMSWIDVTAALSVFGITKDTAIGCVAWQSNRKWGWTLYNTRYRGPKATKEEAQKAMCQIFEDAKKIQNIGKGKDAIKDKEEDRKDDRHGKTNQSINRLW
jgi:hypothetical protein